MLRGVAKAPQSGQEWSPNAADTEVCRHGTSICRFLQVATPTLQSPPIGCFMHPMPQSSARAGERQPHVLRAAAAADHEHEQRSRARSRRTAAPPSDALRAIRDARPLRARRAPARRSVTAAAEAGTRQRRRLSGCIARAQHEPPARAAAWLCAGHAGPCRRAGSSSAVRAKRTNAASRARRPPSARGEQRQPVRIVVAARRRRGEQAAHEARRGRARAARSATTPRTRGDRRPASTAPPCRPRRAPPGRSRDRRPGGRRCPPSTPPSPRPATPAAARGPRRSGSRGTARARRVTRSCSAPVVVSGATSAGA